jgi:hypothetical protein
MGELGVLNYKTYRREAIRELEEDMKERMNSLKGDKEASWSYCAAVET